MLTNTRILHRLVALASLLLVLMGIIGGIGFYTTSHIRESLRTVYQDRTVALGFLDRINTEHHHSRHDLFAAIYSRDPAVVTQKKQKIAERDGRIRKQWGYFLKTQLTPQEKLLVASTALAMQNYEEKRGETLARLDSGDWDGARTSAMPATSKAYHEFTSNLDKLSQLQIDVASAEYASAQAKAAKARTLLISLILAALAGGAALAYTISRSISLPLGRAIQTMQQLTGGHLETEIKDQQRRDEVGAVARAVAFFKDSMIETQRLRESEAEARFFATLNAAMGALPATVAIIDAEAKILFVDQKREKMREELGLNTGGLGSNYMELCAQLFAHDPETEKSITVGVGNVLKGDQNLFEIQYDLPFPNKTRRLSTSITPLPKDIGGAVIMSLDITERTEWEYELEIRSKAMDAALTPIALATTEGQFTYVNKAFLDIWGFKDTSEIIGKTGDALWTEDLDFKGLKKELIETGAIVREMKAKRLDGSICPLWVTASVVKRTNEKSQSVIGCYLDLTARVEMEKALRESEEYSRMLLENFPVGLALSEEWGAFIQVNAAFAAILGYSVEEATGLHYKDITPTEYADLDTEQGNLLLSAGRCGPYEKEYFHKDGHRIPIRATGVLVHRGDKSYVLASVEDITKQRKIDEQVRQSQKLQSIGTLAGGISHEINNLLTPIIGLTEIVRDDLKDEESIQNLEDVLGAADRARQIVAQVLAFSHKDLPHRQRMALAPIVDNAIDLMRIALPSNVTVSTNIQPAPMIEMDETQIQQVIVNLCSNATYAMGLKGGQLEISVKKKQLGAAFFESHPLAAPGEYVLLAVRDTGCGMDKETLSRAFEPFFTTKEVGVGTGMGLAVVHGIVKSHKGVIEVDTTPGAGTIFNVYLPVP